MAFAYDDTTEVTNSNVMLSFSVEHSVEVPKSKLRRTHV